MRVWALGLVVCVVLSGCSGGGGDDATDTETGASDDPTTGPGGSTSGGTTTSGPSSTTGGTGNRPPTATISPSAVAGGVPFMVNFTLDANDADGDELAWSFDADGDATADVTTGTLPLVFAFTYEIAGTFTATFEVNDGKEKVIVTKDISATGTSGPSAIFSDDAEGDASKWTLANEVVFYAAPAPPGPTGQPHPLGDWAQVTDDFRGGAKSWHALYGDNYIGSMTTATTIQVPTGGATLSFWAKGGAEDNSYDGLYVNVGPTVDAMTNMVYQAVLLESWTQFAIQVEEGPIVIQFVFASDVSCSSDPAPVGGPNACGAGWDAGGFWIDDIELN